MSEHGMSDAGAGVGGMNSDDNATLLPGTDIAISRLALGTWVFSGGRQWGPQEDDDSIDAVHAALDGGISTFDTAEAYGEDGYSEAVLGRALKGRRNGAVIATKASKGHATAAQLREACEASLRRLETDYIDLYQLHWPTRDVPYEESIEGLERLKEEGKIRAYGVCNFGPKDMTDFLQAVDGGGTAGEGTAAAKGSYGGGTGGAPVSVGAGPVTNQVAYNLLWRGIEFEVLPQCRRRGIGILPYSPIAQALLTGKYRSADEVPAGRARTKHFADSRDQARHGEPGQEELTFATIERIRGISEDAGIPMGTLAIGWLMAQEGVTSVLAGARNRRQVERNAEALRTSIPQSVLDALTAATDELKAAFGPNTDPWSDRMR